MLTLSFTGACLLAGAFLCAALLVTEPTTHLLENTAKAIADTAEAIDQAMDEAKKKLMAALIWGIVQIQVKMKPKEIEKEQEELLKQINDSTCIGSYSIIDNVFNQINNISVNGNNALDDSDQTTAEPWLGFEVITGGGGGKEPDKKPDKDPKKIAAKVIAGAGMAAQAASILNSFTNNQNTTNNAISPFDLNTITRVTDTGTGQVVIEYKDGTRRIFDKKDVPSFILDSTVQGVSGKGGVNKKDSLDVNLLDDTGKFKDNILENNYQAYINRKIKKGQIAKERLDWKQASDYWTKESPVARGNNFDKTVREADIYDYYEIYLENGKRLDSYDPDAEEIISRKATDLDKISEETYREYLSEFAKKYSRGTKIRSNAYPELDGQELKGKYILEIPASNANIEYIDYYKQIAAEYDVTLRFTEEIQ